MYSRQVQPGQRLCVHSLVGIITSVGLLIGMGSASFAVSPVQPASPAIVVSPNTGLHDNDAVAAMVSGFTAGAGGVSAQCRAATPLSQSDCDLSTAAFHAFDASGSFVQVVTVRSHITVIGSNVDCTASAGACVIAAADQSNLSVNVSAPLAFAAVAPPQRGTAAITTPNYAVNATVNVAVTGWAANANLEIAQCATGNHSFQSPNCYPASQVSADASGGGSDTAYLNPQVYTNDCSAPGSCSIVVADSFDVSNTWVEIPLTFTAATKGDVTLNPATGWHHNDTVTVSGHGWSPGTQMMIDQCDAGCGVWDIQTDYATVADDGSFAVDIIARRFIDASPICGDVFACAVEVQDANASQLGIVSTPTPFTALTAPVRGTLTSPASLPVGTDLSIDVAGWTPEVPVVLGLCPTGTYDWSCIVNPTDIGASGSAVGIDVYQYERVSNADCTVAGACEFVAWDPRDIAGTVVAHSFQSIRPDAGTVVVSPSSGLIDGSSVTISGSGWLPNTTMTVYECSAVGPCSYSPIFTQSATDAAGNFSTSMSLNASVPEGNGWYTDCSSAAGACEIALAEYAGSGVISASVPLTFNDTTQAVTSHYTASEYAMIQSGAVELGLSDAQFQHVGSWFSSYLWLFAGAASAPAVDAGPTSLATSYATFEIPYLTSFATARNMTLAEYQKSGALLLAYLLSLS